MSDYKDQNAALVLFMEKLKSHYGVFSILNYNYGPVRSFAVVNAASRKHPVHVMFDNTSNIEELGIELGCLGCAAERSVALFLAVNFVHDGDPDVSASAPH